ncbi:Hypothetical predicted protein [Xyrichtys novacula]|uniref:Uncharacterized protein n=1 Tax=Xyrichtys novacula TaxID=13765 RepID=A0AAV1EZL0_XYRNO|nr:Hypothetical predicted protein [Xyrichtys novacula]
MEKSLSLHLIGAGEEKIKKRRRQRESVYSGKYEDHIKHQLIQTSLDQNQNQSLQDHYNEDLNYLTSETRNRKSNQRQKNQDLINQTRTGRNRNFFTRTIKNRPGL